MTEDSQESFVVISQAQARLDELRRELGELTGPLPPRRHSLSQSIQSLFSRRSQTNLDQRDQVNSKIQVI